MRGGGGPTCLGKARLLLRRGGVLEAVHTYDVSELEKAIDLVRTFPFVPKSHKPLLVPSVAELYDAVQSDIDITNKLARPTDFAWLEVESDDDAVIEKVLSLFPIHPSTKEDVKNRRNDTELTEIFPSCGYVSINVAAKACSKDSLGSVQDDPVMVSMITFEHFLLTIRRRPIAGDDEMRAHVESMLSSPNSHAEPVSAIVCSLVSGFVKEHQKEPSSLLVDVDNVNEMVLQIQPSRCDQADLLRRIEDLRHRLSRVQASFLAKERLVQQLLLPVMRRIFITSEPNISSRYQRLLSGLLLSIERLRKGRDVLNLSSMSLVSGVSMRLLQHCYWMDFLNNVMTQMSLVTMPICILPGLFTMNVRVPFEESEGLSAFLVITAVTAIVFALGMAYPVYALFRYKPPGGLIPPSIS
ncbi:putative zinc transporter [Trypanosoma grayi]|uniref:putative zinc transporter n=1 Tax=Trypanosoma grayi TaxID=71804 RepID=UPI0004F3FF66|nr:putative zinc transporter [Trypanosoma grayi]KEG13902.1 putative zinc transporter [Trypanosoma grayi]